MKFFSCCYIHHIMPRKSRIDAPGAIHHIIGRGINRNVIFQDDLDRGRFIDRLASLLPETQTACYAWALMPNHFHLLLRSSLSPVAGLMRRLLTGYAVVYNHRHRRCGHLFQNRYKSILCQEEPYLLELVRYIHLNPLRARIVSSVEALDSFPYSGHSVLMGLQTADWQDSESVLSRFGRRGRSARWNYRAFLCEGIERGQRPELTGGGLVRSLGGWEELKKQRRQKAYMKGDERILGDGDYVNELLAAANENLKRSYQLRAMGLNLDTIAQRVATQMGMPLEAVWAAGKHRQRVEARSLLCYWAVRLIGLNMSSLAKRLKISITAVSQSVARGEVIAQKNGYTLS
ncbi:MAG: transposase [Desulfobacterales bacterium]|nr:transposase [Desulfobacterales bacterium]